MEYDKNKTCCFIGHRKINETDRLKAELYSKIEDLIVNNNVDNFLFGSRSAFNDLCLKIVTDLKAKYPQTVRAYVRAEFPYINDDYRAYLLEKYEDTYYPEHIINSGKAAYVERNYEIIKRVITVSAIMTRTMLRLADETAAVTCLIANRKAGTKIAYEYALKNCGHVMNVFAET